ncbi:MAG TPA: heavy metal translocating P-type ATPase [Candidatus Binatia bacterium]|jgi:Cd2+/Zn2+-exporting ATPase|nr:heavy metal translocating P-type ATPase [Candidatus Binatia bacterium]
MKENTLKLDIPLLLPQIDDARDACVHRLERELENSRGVVRAHVKYNGEPAQLCIHYDPDLTSLAAVRRIAREAGADLTDRYPHETIPFAGLDAADTADVLEEELSAVPGMLHARVNYAAGLAFVAYDSEQLTRAKIAHVMRRFGASVRLPRGAPESAKAVSAGEALGEPPARSHETEHDHGSAPSFLPHWMQERWRMILVSLAGIFFLAGWLGQIFFNLPQTAALVLFILAYVSGGYDIATHAIPGLLRGSFDTDVLMLAAASGAAMLGEWTEGAFLLFLFGLAHMGEHYALDRARNAVNALGDLMPSNARVRRDAQVVEEPVKSLRVDDVVVVRPGDRVPVDGAVVRGASTLDQSAITGESVPVTKAEGDEVFAGTINVEHAIDVRVTRVAADNTLSRVMEMVAEAQSQQSPTQQLTQRFTKWFVPGVLVTCLLITVVPPLVGWLTLEQSFYRAMLLLVAASPCALAVGTPAAVLAGIAQAARNGVLIKGGVHLENLGTLRAMAFDKTGTLTAGEFQLTDVVPLNGTGEEELLRIAAAVEQQSNHPLALALLSAAEARSLALPQTGALENVSGRGVRSSIDGQQILVGNLKLFDETDGHALEDDVLSAVERLELQGKTTMAISRDGQFLGVIALADVPRPGVHKTLQQLLDLGVQHLVMLTGDNDDVARQIAQEVGVTHVRAELLPAHKLEAIRALQEEYGTVAMTGDGVNDAPALATATVGIAMGGAGTAVALETADVALMADDLSKLPFAVGLSRKGAAIIRQNLIISLGVIALLIIASVVGLVELSAAVVLHEGSTILVVLNALRLLGYK